MRVGLFDSGVGGLTVLKEFLKRYPDNEYFYFGDTLNIPYGNKSKEELLKLSTKIIRYLESEKVDLIIIACGTISSNIYEDLKKVTKIPLYNVIDTTINYIKDNNYKSIAVLATSNTIKSHIFKDKLDIKVNEIECPLLVPMIENNEINEKVIASYVKNIKEDAIVLGCTHYPIIEDIIKKYTDKEIINMGQVLATKIQLKGNKSGIYLSFSKVTDTLEQNVENILSRWMSD